MNKTNKVLLFLFSVFFIVSIVELVLYFSGGAGKKTLENQTTNQSGSLPVSGGQPAAYDMPDDSKNAVRKDQIEYLATLQANDWENYLVQQFTAKIETIKKENSVLYLTLDLESGDVDGFNINLKPQKDRYIYLEDKEKKTVQQVDDSILETLKKGDTIRIRHFNDLSENRVISRMSREVFIVR